jgi:BMFP domain-containing protein YqiC
MVRQNGATIRRCILSNPAQKSNLMDTKFIDDLATRLAENVPPGIQMLQADMEKSFRAVLQSTFNRLDLVTREEFEAQKKVLSHTRQKVADLEQQITELEARLDDVT